jgi:Xaa-Pro aminopeptidase
LQKLLGANDVDTLLVTSPADWYYLTGFTGEAGLLLVTRRGVTLVTDARFTVQAAEELSGVTVVLQQDGVYRTAGRLLQKWKGRRACIEPNQLTLEQFEALKKATGNAVRFRSVTGLVQSLRACKDPSALAQMRNAANLASEVVEGAIRMLKPGVREFEIRLR